MSRSKVKVMRVQHVPGQLSSFFVALVANAYTRIKKFLKRQILDSSKLKEFADDNF